MKTIQPHLPFDVIKNNHQQYEMRPIKSMHELAYHLNQNSQHNKVSHLTYRNEGCITKCNKKSKRMNKKSISPILQPQQPENYHKSFDRIKQVSLISCKSQPLKITRCKKSSQFNINLVGSKNPNDHKSSRKNVREETNDNKKTRKHFTTQQIDSSAVESHPKIYNEYYNSVKYNIQNPNQNQQTLKRNHSKCPHKQNKKKLQNVMSLENIDSRLTMCEAYIDLGTKKTTLLAQQIDFLLKKEQERHERKLRRKEERQGKGHQHEYHVDEKIKSKNDTFEHLDEKGKKKIKQKHNQSPSKFHYRSCDNRQSSSRLKQLIYFHQKDIPCNSISKTNQLDQLPLKNHIFVHPNQHQTQQQTSIYHQVENNPQKIPSPVKNIETHLTYSSIRMQKTQSCLQNIPHHYNAEQNVKSERPPYEEDSEYLLEEYENDTLRQTKKYLIQRSHNSHNNHHELNYPFVNSQQLDLDYNSGENQYLTHEFDPSQHHQMTSMNPKRLTFSKHLNQQSQISNQSSAQSSKSRKVGQFTQSPLANVPQYIEHENNQITSLKLTKLKNHQNNSNQTSERQYTFINHSSIKKSNPSAQFEIIDSNFNSPEHLDYNISSNENTEAQLIRQFDELVIAAAEEETPMKKKLIREQIYRTSQQVRELKNSRETYENNPKISRSIQNYL